MHISDIDNGFISSVLQFAGSTKVEGRTLITKDCEVIQKKSQAELSSGVH